MSAAEARSVVVVDTSDEHRGDFETSFAMHGLDLILSRSVEEALDIIKTKAPAVVFCRLRVGDDENAAATLRDDLFKYEGLCDIPIVLVDEEDVLKAREPYVRTFAGSAELPLQFPSFPKFVAGLLSFDHRSAGHLSEREDLLEASAPSTRSTAVPSPEAEATPPFATESTAPAQDSVSQQRERRRIVVHALLLRVLDEVFRSGEFDKMPLEQIPVVVERITTQVCSEIDLEKLFS